ncbi:histidinol phosphate phosphatase domain-containing protein [Desulfoplanes sp.]
MIDLHTHTIFSDGDLIPAEAAQRAAVAGYRAMAFTDHADASNLDFILENICRVSEKFSVYTDIDLLCGVELTHVPPGLIEELTQQARAAGAEIVVVHGETIVEPVAVGTNLAAINAGVDILAHPGLIRPEEVALAANNNVALEITTRKGHCLTNGHVAALAKEMKAPLVINNDAHTVGDMVPKKMRKMIALGAGMSAGDIRKAEANSQAIVQQIMKKRIKKLQSKNGGNGNDLPA